MLSFHPESYGAALAALLDPARARPRDRAAGRAGPHAQRVAQHSGKPLDQAKYVCRHGLSYSRFIAGLKATGIEVNRKVLADIAISDATAFAELASKAKLALASK